MSFCLDRLRGIALVTDFGDQGPYVGQMELCLTGRAPQAQVTRLISDLPPFRPDLAAYLLPALARDVTGPMLYLCVVDPGVGGERGVLAVEADGSWFVGPDNGLLALVVRRAAQRRVLRVTWRPRQMSASFHGRDLFAPVAAMLFNGERVDGAEIDVGEMAGKDSPQDRPCIIYGDRYGNLLTGLRGDQLDRRTTIQAGPSALRFARTFCEVPSGTAFWYEDAFGLVELAVNQGRADQLLGLRPGDGIRLLASA
jgi:S-adenosyl-L-methionine hydrolase (adenosine-forming)